MSLPKCQQPVQSHIENKAVSIAFEIKTFVDSMASSTTHLEIPSSMAIACNVVMYMDFICFMSLHEFHELLVNSRNTLGHDGAQVQYLKKHNGA